MTTYLALLRGINVGGHARVAMVDLRRVFADLGHADIKTHIQSGNVIFTSPDEPTRLALEIEHGIAHNLGLTITIVIRTKPDLARVLANNPFAKREADPAKLHVAFLADAADPSRAAALRAPAGGPDELALAGRELYLYYPSGSGRSKLTNVYIERQLGVAATARNWRVVTTLHALMQD